MMGRSMQAVSKKALFASAVGLMLTACHGGSNSTPSTSPPTVGSFNCPIVNNSNQSTLPGIAISCTTSGAKTIDGSVPNYSWNFGDQIPSGSTQVTTGSSVTHVYAQPGYYQVTLTVTDDHGTSASQVQIVPVTLPLPSGITSGAPATIDGQENWAWISGSKYENSAGDFQTLLQASPLNQPSARQNAATWTTTATANHPAGQLWVFGGLGFDSTGTAGSLNDLWSFDPANGQWTWVAGSNKAAASGTWPATVGTTAATNVISARGAMAQWTDANGNSWIFGGTGYDKNGNSSYLSDMWMLDKTTGEATWEAGPQVGNSPATTSGQGVANPGNIPAGRSFATTWVSKGVFYMFGGQGYNGSNVAPYNDLWRYDPSTKAGWVWVSGTTTASNTAGSYGTISVPAATNSPGARVSAQSWVDKTTGNLWMFGGNGYDSAGSYGALNDLWMYDTTAKMWKWVAGSTTQGASSVYGTPQHSTPASGTVNAPGGRVGTLGWVDPTTGNFWLFGGSGSDSTSTTSANDGGGALNELWVYNPTPNTSTSGWTWMGGVNVDNIAGVYTTPYPSTVGSKYNSPGSRVWGGGWVDNSGNFWMFGGAGLDSAGNSGYLNDLWMVQLTLQPAP
jgi:hypothetical protein